MEQLPSSIEQYLEDAGFTGTEIVIVHKLLEGNGLTLRELAAKTGKSTGALDSGIKKLIKKKIVTKELVNGNPRYQLSSMQSIAQWMEEDMKLRQEALSRRHQNFSSFIDSVEKGKNRPEMEHFEGVEGLKQCYMKLLKQADGEMLRYFPVVNKEEEDPLRDFRVQYFRERRKHEVFSKVIAHNTPLGRRFQGRDAFEYRQTKLVEEDVYTFTFEKIIAGDMVACIDLQEKTACLIRYPELAGIERSLFEGIWKQKNDAQPDSKPIEEPVLHTVPLATETLSQLREFFLSAKSIATVAVLGVVAAGMTYGLYVHNSQLNLERVMERAKSIAATGALQFEVEDLKKLQTKDDINRPEYKKVVYQLNEIRRQNEGVSNAYILRESPDPNFHAFIADADSIDPSAIKDLNGDGVINDQDLLSPPGQLYNIKDQPYNNIRSPSVVPVPIKDQWGTWITGNGPIFDESGTFVAYLGIDIDVEKVGQLTRSSFEPIYWFLAFFFLFLLIRLAAFNRLLLQELRSSIRSAKVVLSIGAATCLAAAVTFSLYHRERQANIQRIRESVTSIAATAAPRFNADTLTLLQGKEDVSRPEYIATVLKLAAIQKENPRTEYVYLLRATQNANIFEFIASSDALDPEVAVDSNGDGIMSEADELVVPGQRYDISNMNVLMERSYSVPNANTEPYTDQWGTFYTGYAPVRNGSGQIVAVLAVDIQEDELKALNTITFVPLYVLFAVFVLALLFRWSSFSGSLLYKLLIIFKKRIAVLWLIFTCTVVGGSIFWVDSYLYYREMEQTGRRLMAIAATAAPMFDPEDLNQLHWARDMQTDAYQRVFKQLNDIRKRNPEIRYAYIFRPTDAEGIWEFVVDADSNYYIETLQIDHNHDKVLDSADVNVHPGRRYDIEHSSIFMYKEGLDKPTYERYGTTDQWGTFVSGSAPIRDLSGKTIAIFGMDVVLEY